MNIKKISPGLGGLEVDVKGHPIGHKADIQVVKLIIDQKVPKVVA